MVKELLDLYAARQVFQGFKFPPLDQFYKEFEATFEYEETPDQTQAIEEVMRDMGSPKPMDRLICGDVGYGKTEVAIRAAYRAVMSGKQVAILVPTTVLAQQHHQTFRERFKTYPVVIEVVEPVQESPGAEGDPSTAGGGKGRYRDRDTPTSRRRTCPSGIWGWSSLMRSIDSASPIRKN